MLRIIKTQARKKPDFLKIYGDAYERKLSESVQNPNSRLIWKQLIFYGTRYLNLIKFKPDSKEMAENHFNLFNTLFNFIGFLTPAELVTVFPITKTFDGERWQEKDYFTTTEELKKIGMDKPIGFENVSSLLWDYRNRELTELMVHYMDALSDAMQFNGQPSLAEQIADKFNIGLYYEHTDKITGQKYLQSRNTGKTIPFKVAPSYLKVVK